MKKKFGTIFGLLMVAAMLVSVVAPIGAAPPSPDRLTATQAQVSGVVENLRSGERSSYIIRLEGEPLALFKGDVAGLQATNPKAIGESKLDVNSAASVAYVEYLTRQQDQFIAEMQTVTSSAEVLYTYKVTYNGVAAVMTTDEAARVAELDGVISVQRDKRRFALTEVTPDFIGAVNVWAGSAAGVDIGTKGEGIIVGVIDTGIWPEHPSFADDGSYPAPPESWGGECAAPSDDSADYECSNKLIGVQYFLNTYNTEIGYDGLFHSGRDDDGHGTHTASTSAGNENIAASILGVDRGMVSGMAPRAHVASYKGLGPQGGFNSDLVAAIDKAVADGVDVINYSVGGGASNPWNDADSLAYLAAREAGIFVATSAGNSGPGPDTVGSPGNAPWVATVGASTSNRQFVSDITIGGPDDPPTGLWGASVTDGVTEFNLIDAEGIADSAGDDSGLCLNPFLDGTFQSDDVVLCKRGQIARVLRGEYVQAGGGGAVLLYNANQAQGVVTDSYVIPAVHLKTDTGLELKDYVNAHPGEVTVSFTQGAATFSDSDPKVISDMMAAFSSRGPNGPVPAIIKPDVTAPGVQILAGASPEHDPDGSAQGELFQAIGGTSMASPHTAGAGALLKAVHPDWSPAAIQSALMTTAITNVVKEDGTTQADPFDMGSGRIDLNKAADPGLVFDMTAEDYENGEDDPAGMNLPSLGFGLVVSSATISRTATSVLDTETTWQVSVEAPEGVTISVSPDPVVVPANGEASFQITVDAGGKEGGLYFGQVNLTSGDHMAHMPVAFEKVPATWSSLLNLDTQYDKDRVSFDLSSGLNIDPFVVNAYGLVDAVVFDGGPLVQDPDQDPDTDFCGEGQECWPFSTTGGELWWVFQVRNATIADADLYLYFDANGDGEFTPDELIDQSTTGSSDEEVEAVLPDGDYLVQVQAWGGGGTYDLKVYDVGTDDLDASMMVIDAPESISAGEDYAMKFMWDQQIDEGEEYLGLVTLGSSTDPVEVGGAPVRITGDVPAVDKMADVAETRVGKTINYAVTLANTSATDVTMVMSDTIPANVMVDPDSLTGGATLNEGVISWEGTLPPPANTVTIAPSDHFGYVSLASIGVSPIDLCESCDEAAVNFTGDPVSYLGAPYETICMVSNGYLVMGGCASGDDISFEPQNFPDPVIPNNVVAPLWMDFDLDGGDGEGGGTWYAANISDGTTDWRVFEWEDAQRFGEEGTAFTFQVWIQKGDEAVTLAYGRLDGPFDASAVGAENADASAGDSYYFNDGDGGDTGTQPTLDDVLDVSGQAGPALHIITYSAEAVAEGDAENTAMVSSGMAMDSDTASVFVDRAGIEGSVTQTTDTDPLIYGSTVDVDVSVTNYGDDIDDATALVWLDDEVSYVDGSATNGAMPLTVGSAMELATNIGLVFPQALYEDTAMDDVVAVAWTGMMENEAMVDFGFSVMVSSTTGSIQHAVNMFNGYMPVATFASDAMDIVESVTVTLPLVADTWVNSGAPLTSLDDSAVLRTLTDGVNNTLLTFDSSALPADADIFSANLSVYVQKETGAAGKSLSVLNTEAFHQNVTFATAPAVFNPSEAVEVTGVGTVTFDVESQLAECSDVCQLAIAANGPFGRVSMESLETFNPSPATLVVTYLP